METTAKYLNSFNTKLQNFAIKKSDPIKEMLCFATLVIQLRIHRLKNIMLTIQQYDLGIEKRDILGIWNSNSMSAVFAVLFVYPCL